MRNAGEWVQNLLFRLAFAILVVSSALPIDSGVYFAQERQPRPEQPSSASSQGPESTGLLTEMREDYRIRPGDVLDVQVDRAPELSGTYTVTADGAFKVLYLGQVTARDKTREELVSLIADGLRGRYLKNPRVTVVIRRPAPRRSTLFLQGSFRNPGIYQVEGRPSLLRLISLAGGLDKDHGSTAFIIREIRPQSEEMTETEAAPVGSAVSPSAETGSKIDPAYELHKVNISALLKGDFSLDSAVKAGDIINVPSTDVFFVAGEVKKPGSFALREGTTLSQAIFLAEGLTFKAAAGSGTILREDPATGKRVEIPVDIRTLMKSSRNDVLVQANDIIRVPGSGIRSAAGVILRGLGYSLRLPYRY